ncbi:MAG: GspH/FimT family protein [Candidatus Komeilibacteria bacterium]|nr:GspH/FimT family protein [Candidatus Komeilibacteria bacterium]
MFSQRQGVSLLELTVAVAIIFIIAAISFPSFNGYLKYQDLKNSAKIFVSRVKQAQQETVTRQIKFAVELDLQTGDYRQLKLIQPNQVTEEYSLSDQVFFASTTGILLNQVVFNPTGAADQSGEIILESLQSGQQIKITIHPSGYVSWENN